MSQALIEGMSQLCTRPPGDSSSPEVSLPTLTEAWIHMCVQLFSSTGTVRSAQLELPAKDPRYVETMNEVPPHC